MMSDIQKMPIQNKYNHIMAALGVVLQGDKHTQEHKNATAIIRMHIKYHKERSMEIAKVAYSS
jgi:hypothetical protein